MDASAFFLRSCRSESGVGAIPGPSQSSSLMATESNALGAHETTPTLLQSCPTVVGLHSSKCKSTRMPIIPRYSVHLLVRPVPTPARLVSTGGPSSHPVALDNGLAFPIPHPSAIEQSKFDGEIQSDQEMDAEGPPTLKAELFLEIRTLSPCYRATSAHSIPTFSYGPIDDISLVGRCVFDRLRKISCMLR